MRGAAKSPLNFIPMRTKMTPLPESNATNFAECPYVCVEWIPLPFCRICGYISRPEIGCIPRMERHLAEAHGFKPPEGKHWWMDWREMGERLP